MGAFFIAQVFSRARFLVQLQHKISFFLMKYKIVY